MPSFTARKFLGLTRLAVGVSSWAAPRTAVRGFGIDPRRSDGFVTRLFGSRELFLASLLLAAPEAKDVRTVAKVGAAIDALDVVAAGIELRAGRMSPWTTISGGAGAALFAALGPLVARDARPE